LHSLSPKHHHTIKTPSINQPTNSYQFTHQHLHSLSPKHHHTSKTPSINQLTDSYHFTHHHLHLLSPKHHHTSKNINKPLKHHLLTNQPTATTLRTNTCICCHQNIIAP
jgi:hypothetical protein